MNTEYLEELKQQLNELGYDVNELDVTAIQNQDLGNDFCAMYPPFIILENWFI